MAFHLFYHLQLFSSGPFPKQFYFFLDQNQIFLVLFLVIESEGERRRGKRERKGE